jgi:hypothetical protein
MHAHTYYIPIVRPPSLFRRLAFIAVAIVQMSAPVLVSVAEGQLAKSSVGQPGQVHVEDHTHRGCVPVHPDSCALCQYLTHFAAEKPEPAFVPVAVVERVAQSCEAFRLPATLARTRERTRAPPAV